MVSAVSAPVLMYYRPACPTGAAEGNRILGKKANGVLAVRGCTPCVFGLYVLAPGACGGMEDPWPSGTVMLMEGVCAVPNHGNTGFEGEQYWDFNAVDPGDGESKRFIPVGAYRTMAQVETVVGRHGATLAAFRDGANTRFGSYDVVQAHDWDCPGGHCEWPPGAGQADFSEKGFGEEFDLAMAAGSYSCAVPTEGKPGCRATWGVDIWLEHRYMQAAEFCVGAEGDEEWVTLSPVRDSDGNVVENRWFWQGTVQTGPCQRFHIRAFNQTYSHYAGRIECSWGRVDCPDTSEAAEAAWQAVVAAMYDIPGSSVALCELLAAEELAAGMGED